MKFRFGDWVRVLSDCDNDRKVGELGIITNVDDSEVPCNVHFEFCDKRGSHEKSFYEYELELANSDRLKLKFKVNDRVRLIKGCSDYSVGDIATIIKVDYDDDENLPYLVEVDNTFESCWVSEPILELVNEE